MKRRLKRRRNEEESGDDVDNALWWTTGLGEKHIFNSPSSVGRPRIRKRPKRLDL